MKKTKIFFTWALFAVFTAASMTSCSSDDNAPTDADLLRQAEGIIELTSGIGDWDAAYLTKRGYFCKKNDIMRSSTANESKYGSVTYMSADGSDVVSLISTKEDYMPTQLVSKNGTLYFSFPNDTILELVYDDGQNVEMLDSIAYSKSQIKDYYHGNDSFKSALSVAASLLKGNKSRSMSGGSMASVYGEIFSEVSELPYVEDNEISDGISTDASGNYDFSETISEWYESEVSEYICNTLSLWTGKATYKVGGSSCTLSASIWCPSNEYNQYGTYGIICDANRDNLYVGNAEYEDNGYQSEDDLSFSVDFRGLKPNTTYYYRAFYKFNSTDHGNIIAKHGNPTDPIVYDTVIKSFETGDNILTVDVVMCIDVTGSMSDIIYTVKRNAIGFYDSFDKCCQDEGIQLAGLNAQVIAYRDKNVDSNWLESSATYSLPDQRSEFDSFVNGLYADGGGDTPESGLEALDAAFSKVDWGADDGYHRQVIILWTDADYLTDSYSNVSLSELNTKWNSMPSGRRLVLFAPYGTYNSNGGDWGNLDSWKNIIHEDNLYSGFNDFEYILKSIIGELTSRSASRGTTDRVSGESIFFSPNN